MLLDWVSVDPGLLAGAAVLTPGRGVWQEIRKGQYKYTWYAYGLDELGERFYSVRVSGLATLADCNNVDISYTYEIFYPSVDPHRMSEAVPVEVIPTSPPGQAHETRVPLTVTTP
jgi:hypothetical protein